MNKTYTSETYYRFITINMISLFNIRLCMCVCVWISLFNIRLCMCVCVCESWKYKLSNFLSDFTVISDVQ